MTINIEPASKYSIEELTDLYNQTRVDYLVPMPMSVERLQHYVDDFDVDLDSSCVAYTDTGVVLGLGMLGLRENIAWITRLGVIPSTRRSGAGEAMMNYMLGNADSIGMNETHLEVISNNEPAHKLFLKKGFVDKDLYLVLRRAPKAVSEPVFGDVEWLEKKQALQTLQSYPNHLTWITAYKSMENAPDTGGLKIELPNGDKGWLAFRLQKFYVTHLIMHTETGDPVNVGRHLLHNLFFRYPRVDTYAENINGNDPHLPAFIEMSFFENFSRIEMRRKANNNL